MDVIDTVMHWDGGNNGSCFLSVSACRRHYLLPVVRRIQWFDEALQPGMTTGTNGV